MSKTDNMSSVRSDLIVPVTYRRLKHSERPSVNVTMSWLPGVDGMTITTARVRVGALGSRPQPLKTVEDTVRGISVAEIRSMIGALLPKALNELKVNEDRHGCADYKRHPAGVLLLRNADEAMVASERA